MGKSMMVVWLIGLVLWSGSVWAGDGTWRAEFERICVSTGSGDRLGSAELEVLIADSDRLLERIAVEAGAEGKVYLFRLRKCRDFFVFMRESGMQRGSGNTTP